jgi:hypothetical protein
MALTVYAQRGRPSEEKIVEGVKNLYAKYNIPSFTDEIVVEEGATSHSHPILTLNTRVADERLVLFTLVHEQFHWYAQTLSNYETCIAYLKDRYSDDGEHNKSGKHPNSYWEHIIVCFNTRAWLKRQVSREDLIWVYEQWQPYPTLEKFIEAHYETLEGELGELGAIYSPMS